MHLLEQQTTRRVHADYVWGGRRRKLEKRAETWQHRNRSESRARHASYNLPYEREKNSTLKSARIAHTKLMRLATPTSLNSPYTEVPVDATFTLASACTICLSSAPSEKCEHSAEPGTPT
ncbi:hypothetical protein BpHYR1_044446 [Brachionus plicatilis]|uniref:Uncharacterized protein n=1 Tax=Brachionus plicatilis TaxID=10195 RepID=A0A3M7QSK2_BRAPC|nr:hypothetical protein BpHYR1_044446 [Brachionus plicatilis]